MLTLYGNPGTNYEVDYSTNLLSAWQYGWRAMMTNLSEVFAANGSLPQVFYRAVVSSPPVIAPVSNRVSAVNSAVIITNLATEPGAAGQKLTFSFAATPPAGALLTTNGVFIWTPDCVQGSTTNSIQILVTDNGTPPLSSLLTFTVVVGDCVQVGIGSTVVQTGQSASVPVNLLSTVGLTNLNFTLVYPANRFTNWFISATNPAGSSGTAQLLGPSNTFFGVATTGGNVLEGPTVVGSLTFSALPGASAFIQVAVTGVAGTKSDGSLAGNSSGQGGRVVVIGLQSLLEAWLSTNQSRMLTLYGNPGASYEVDYSTNLSRAWQYGWRLPMTNLSEAFPANTALPQVFYRAVDFSANPPILDLNSFSRTNSVLLLYGQNSSNYTVLSGTNLLNSTNWASIAGFTLTNSFQFINAGAATNQAQYFRAKRQ